MPLRDTAVPRMAGHLPFMRGPVRQLADVGAGRIAVFGAPIGTGTQDTTLGPLSLRETSSYFGSHFTSNMKAAMDIDQRRILDSTKVAGRIVDLGDIDFGRSPVAVEASIAHVASAICRQGALPMMLGGATRHAAPMRRGMEAGLGRSVTLTVLDGEWLPSADARLLVAIDLASVASTWHGATPRARFSGLSLSDIRKRVRLLGTASLAGIAVTGLEPTRAGLATVKTAQRLVVTAVLDLIYGYLDALRPAEAAHG
jgi:hypothetical protein